MTEPTPLPADLTARIRAADRLLRDLMDAVGDSDEPRFTSAQYLLLDERVDAIRAVLAAPGPERAGDA